MDKIRHLKRSQIDSLLWDKSISESENSRIYAYSWFLDSMTENWDALIMGDYEAVMPLPWKSKYGLKYIYRPPFMQQLGAFSKSGKVDFALFLKHIPNYFVKVDYFYNNKSNNENSRITFKIRQNYILPLNQTHLSIYSNYKVDLKKNLKSANMNNCEIFKADKNAIPQLIELYKNAYGRFYKHFDSKVYLKLITTLQIALDKGFASLNIATVSKEIGAANLILKDDKRIYYFLGAPNELGKKNKCTPFLINEILKEHSEQSLLFDFEGSEIPSVASFYEKFNPEVEYYYQVSYYNLFGFKF